MLMVRFITAPESLRTTESFHKKNIDDLEARYTEISRYAARNPTRKSPLRLCFVEAKEGRRAILGITVE